MSKILHGVVHGRTIELTDDPGIADGQSVKVIVRPAKADKPWGEGIRRSAGALADDWTDEDDRILEEIYQDRGRSSSRNLPQ